ncbi:MAG: transcriptional regulator, TetR family, partial [Firmicutes bacterium]|nr:transcriptional regulator, TetR family [Bacillota bacterium]
MAIIASLIDSIYEKSPDDLLTCQFKLAEELMAKALGMKEGTIRIVIDDSEQ